MTPEAERFNGWAAMLGFVAAVGAYVTTGQIIPGWFQFQKPQLLKIAKTIFLILIMTPEAERFNGWAAMLGFVAAVGAYVTTGQIIPGWF